MVDDADRRRLVAQAPIPSYDEATSSQSPVPGQEQGPLLPHYHYRHHTPSPTSASPRSSSDSDLQLPEVSAAANARSHDELDRRQVEELDYLDPSASDPEQRQSRLYHRARLRSKFSQRLSNLSASLSSLRLPSFRAIYAAVPRNDAPAASDATPPAPTQPTPTRQTLLMRLIDRIPEYPTRYRISASTAARLCGLLSLVVLVYLLFLMGIFPGRNRHMGTRFDPEAVRGFVQDTANADSIRGYLTHIAGYDHVAGTEGDLYMAEWMKERWSQEAGMDEVQLVPYWVYLNYPNKEGRSVSIISPESEKWSAMLEEEAINPDQQQTLAWHGHSRNGDVQGPLIYVNSGSRSDFAHLHEQGIDLSATIALIRHYGPQNDQALKIKAAEEAGCIGVLIYSDPKDDGADKGLVWPDGPWRPDDSLQRGSVSSGSWVVGDPLTPGYASKENAKRLPKDGNPSLPNIPSLPLAWRDARVLLSSLQGIGVRVPSEWVGGGPDFEIDWFSGNTTSLSVREVPIVRLQNMNDENEKQQIWNLHGLIHGVESPSKRIYVGSHRDAWCFGSVDPGSGNAVMMEVASIFGRLREMGWRPLRTIEFVSWDAKEYNLIGSTEYVEDNIGYLRDNAVAYLNVDSGVYGPDASFRAAGSPVWQRPMMHVLDRVTDPMANATLLQLWNNRNGIFEGLGGGGDYVAFQDIAGTPSVDFGFAGTPRAFPSHSCYDTFDWTMKFGDPDFTYHKLLGQIWALLILEIADRPLIPYDLRAYADAIQNSYISSLEEYAASHQRRDSTDAPLDLGPLRDAALAFHDRAADFHGFEDYWSANVLAAGGLENRVFALRRFAFNDALAHFERDLLDLTDEKNDDIGAPHGPFGRSSQLKHIIFGPQAWPSSGGPSYFPAIRDALDARNTTLAQALVQRAADVLSRATDNLRV